MKTPGPRERGSPSFSDDALTVLIEQVGLNARDDVSTHGGDRQRGEHERQRDDAQLQRTPPEVDRPLEVRPPVEPQHDREVRARVR